MVDSVPGTLKTPGASSARAAPERLRPSAANRPMSFLLFILGLPSRAAGGAGGRLLPLRIQHNAIANDTSFFRHVEIPVGGFHCPPVKRPRVFRAGFAPKAVTLLPGTRSANVPNGGSASETSAYQQRFVD